MSRIPGFTDLDRATRELLYGGKTGAFQFDNIVQLTSKTADGVEFSTTTSVKGERLESIIKAAYGTEKYGFTASILGDGKVLGTATLKNPAPGVNVTLSGTIPDENSGKLALDYSAPYFTLKSKLGLTNSPKLDISASTGKDGFGIDGKEVVVVGGDATYDTNKADVTAWSAGLGYHGLDYQLGGILTDRGNTLKLHYAHNLDAARTAGAEVTRPINGGDTKAVVGYSHRLQDGAVSKLRIDTGGLLTILYEQEVRPKIRMGVTGQVDVRKPDTRPKLGFAFDVKQ
eukprot:jgi/Astpho2/9541/Aster-03826